MIQDLTKNIINNLPKPSYKVPIINEPIIGKKPGILENIISESTKDDISLKSLLKVIDNASVDSLNATIDNSLSNYLKKRTWDDIPFNIDLKTNRKEFELTAGEDKDILNKVPPPENADIKVKGPNGDYTIFKTDEQGRVIEVTKEKVEIIPPDQRQRDSNQTTKTSDVKDGNIDENGKKLDDGGHLIADQFGGCGEQINLVPMDSEINRYGEWRKIEKDIEKANLEGKEVTDLKIEVEYEGDSKRPSGFTVTYKVDGEEKLAYVDNTNGGK